MLKGLGTILVFAVHYSQSFSGAPLLLRQICMLGQLGVQAFLLCTGFLLTNSLQDQENFSYGRYLKKRFYNLAPMYWLSLILYALMQLLFNCLDIKTLFSGKYDFWGIFVNATFLHGLIPAYNNTVVPGGWFVGTVILMYILLPPLLMRRGRKKISILAAPIVSLISMAGCLVLQYIAPDLTGNNRFFFCSVLCQMPAVLEGIRLFEQGYSADISVPRCLIKVAALGLACAGIFYIGNAVLVCLIPWLGSSMFVAILRLMCFCKSKGWLQRPMRYLEKLGRNSYPIFLLHFLFAWFVPDVVKHVLGARVNETILLFILILPCFAAAALFGERLGAGMQLIIKKLR